MNYQPSVEVFVKNPKAIKLTQDHFFQRRFEIYESCDHDETASSYESSFKIIVDSDVERKF